MMPTIGRVILVLLGQARYVPLALNITRNGITKHQSAHIFSCADAGLPNIPARFLDLYAPCSVPWAGATSPVKRIPTGRGFPVHTSRCAHPTAAVRAMTHLVPDLGPFAPPLHRATTRGAGLDRQVGFSAGARHLEV